MTRIATLAAGALLATGLATIPAHAQSTEEVLGTVIGGTLGTVIGGEIDGGRNKTDGQLIGGAIGGTLGYVIGDSIDDRNDDKRRYRQYRTYNQGYSDARYHAGYPRTVYQSQPVYSQPYYSQPRYYQPRPQAYRSHPVHVVHPGRGNAYGHYKRRGW